jgi:hypothetical protein
MLVCACFGFSQLAWSTQDAYPNKPIRLIVASSPGEVLDKLRARPENSERRSE